LSGAAALSAAAAATESRSEARPTSADEAGSGVSEETATPTKADEPATQSDGATVQAGADSSTVDAEPPAERSGDAATGADSTAAEPQAGESTSVSEDAEALSTGVSTGSEASAASADTEAAADDAKPATTVDATETGGASPAPITPGQRAGSTGRSKAKAKGRTTALSGTGKPAAKTAAAATGAAAAAAATTKTPTTRTPNTDRPTSGAPVSGAPTSGAAAAGRPVGASRPPWQGMPVRPASSGGAGVSVLVARFGRRPVLVLIAVLVVIGLVLALVLAGVFSDGERKPVGGGATTAAPTAAASATGAPAATTAPAAPAATPSVAASGAPTPTPSAAPATGSSLTLPDGWHIYRDPSGFRVPVPKSWQVSREGTEVYFREGGNGGRLMIIGQSNKPKADAVKDWRTQEKQRRGGYANYRRLGIRAVPYFREAADWEFTYTTPAGNPQRVNKRGFVVSKNQAYGIHWSTSPGDWDDNQDELALIYKGFKPAG
jgi:hypothetical protein